MLSAIHVAAAGFAIFAGAFPEAACAVLAALVYGALATRELTALYRVNKS
jgi:hypothetical protein